MRQPSAMGKPSGPTVPAGRRSPVSPVSMGPSPGHPQPALACAEPFTSLPAGSPVSTERRA